MNELQELKDRFEQLTIEMESLQSALIPYEAALENPETIEQGREREVRDQYNERKRKVDSLDLQIHMLSRKIHRRENLTNSGTLMEGYIDAMANWKADEQELNEKRQSLSTRLDEIRQQALDEIAKARQAETEAATAYAQAVAWGDTEGEKTANADAQKAAKNLTAATEHHRRQQLIITALEQELITVEQHITEAQKEHKEIEKKALRLAHIALEEKWNEAAQALLDAGGKLWAAYRLIDQDQIRLFKLVVPEEGENFGNWNWNDLADRAKHHSIEDVLTM
ncbi:putative membrane protein [Pseudomonas laurylsulfativorans]|uniref:chromosome segregation protein SMC n=1 Tax=Pseudomonas laurylsulfativorans TaxID=1943631 RepID=UPI00209ECE80|nr:chromosome segregation protein SMC [Pseudomonas laurylsulfativorans]MCP1420963.1 putative membrane protein [Pseudomonas laurylsulfativorans]